ncbi:MULTISPECIES: cysteine hydrolase family protein [unclassified Pseudovibrio]|uniref:cysteine hydrolase family protein n=1 Tax=unclassified Pseudovibrio TaxID=2627060 RepID=UPI0007AE5543|nr:MULTISPECIES: cysteine hydrolase family protein [unclassified Pseudovibrio]KZK98192.1 Streptothricin hydrolase [Pseudovibrio sp. W74]KZK99679.1 Streptothricin hydrolase [Pseudovibrio sp. Ad5]KZL04146.1 Streptothricin hydrolase [Pseudovibrio sp. Ad14]
MTKKALIIIDCQNDFFPGGKCELEGQVESVANIQRLLTVARKNNDLIVHIQHLFKDKYAPFLAEGTIGAELHDSCKPIEGEHVVVKYKANSYLNTNLRQILEDAGIEEIVICGGMSHLCIDAAARATVDLGYPITVIYDACATCDLEFEGEVVPAKYVQGAIMAALSFFYGKVISTDEYLSN